MAEQPEQPRRAKKPLSDSAPWLPVPWELADISAIQSLEQGNASPEQQTRALKWIMYTAAGLNDFAYRPGSEDGRRDTDFALGRQFVGQQIRKMLILNTAALRRNESNADPAEPKY